MSLRVSVAICTSGRPQQVAALLLRLSLQTRLPDHVVLSVFGPRDLPDLARWREKLEITVVSGPKGLAAQRNRALEALMPETDFVVFFDDDYLPAKASLERVQRVFQEHPGIAGITGHLLADGATEGPIAPDRAQALLDAQDLHQTNEIHLLKRNLLGLYGCNMAVRVSAIGSERFDTRLPLYGWQEDFDFGARLDGERVRTDALVGVHCATRTGRETTGLRLGYAQVANVVYLMRKGTMPVSFGLRLMARNVAGNLLLSGATHVDRAARARGNWRAVRDVLRGQVDPMRMLLLPMSRGGDAGQSPRKAPE